MVLDLIGTVLQQQFYDVAAQVNLNGIVLLQQLINGISRGSVYALIALGYTMVYGIIELINFAHGDVFMLGTFTAVGLYSVFGLTTSTGAAGLVFGLLAVLV